LKTLNLLNNLKEADRDHYFHDLEVLRNSTKMVNNHIIGDCRMSARLSASQNKIRLLVLFLFTVLIIVCVRVYQAKFHAGAEMALSHAENSASTHDDFFTGLRHASSREVHQALPEARGKATVLYFGSRLCHDCQRMRPVIRQMTSQFPHLYFKKIDVLDDQQRLPAVFRAFKPMVVPITVLITPQGEISNVLYDYQKPEVVTAALNHLQQTSTGKTVKTEKSPLKS